jgi:hypothetical protein
MPPATLDYTKVGSKTPGFAAFLREPDSEAPVGHVDQTFKVRGCLRVDDSEYAVACVANHDHSWSPRAEFKSACGIFDNIHFGEELTLFTMGAETALGQAVVTHAYILRGAELRAVAEISVRYERRGVITTGLTYEVSDSSGETYHIEAEVLHAIEQDQGSNGYTVMNYLRPRWKEAEGYGESMWHWDIPRMQGIVRQMRAASGQNLSVHEALGRWAGQPT